MPKDPLTYESSGVSYASMDPVKKIAQQSAKNTSSNLEKFGTELTAKSHPPTYGRRTLLSKIEKTLNFQTLYTVESGILEMYREILKSKKFIDYKNIKFRNSSTVMK